MAFVGPIGFIGLVAPHIARMLFGEDHRFYLPASALIGALVLSLASIASKNLIPGAIIPVGIVASLVGVPLLFEHHFTSSGADMSDQTVSGLSLSHFSAGYPRRKVIENLTVPHLPRGKITALLGPNGSGKSTLMRAMAGLGPCRGELLLEGENLLTQPFSRRAEQVVYLPQTLPAGVHLHVLESIIVAQRAAGGRHSPQRQEEVMALLRQLGIAHLAMSYLDQLSGGQKRLGGSRPVADPPAAPAAARRTAQRP